MHCFYQIRLCYEQSFPGRISCKFTALDRADFKETKDSRGIIVLPGHKGLTFSSSAVKLVGIGRTTNCS